MGQTAKRPQPGERYEDSSHQPCQVIAAATHAQTGEELLIYQKLYGDFGVYAQPLAEFGQEPAAKEQAAPVPEQAEGTVDPKLMAFLEADTCEERYNILSGMRDVITDGMIDTMAVVMDTVIPEGDLDKRFDDLRYVIRTRQQYEYANRLR